jgi:hypothetical protein
MTRGPCTSKWTSKHHPSRGGPLAYGPSSLRPSTTVKFAPSTFQFIYIYTSCYVLHFEFLNKTYLMLKKKVNYFSHDLFIDLHHDFS